MLKASTTDRVDVELFVDVCKRIWIIYFKNGLSRKILINFCLLMIDLNIFLVELLIKKPSNK